MLYIKTKINDQVEMKVDLYEDEIFTDCGDCGKPMQVDFDEIVDIRKSGFDLVGTTFFCEECSVKKEPTT